MFEEIQNSIDRCEYDNWELYFLIASGITSLLIYIDIRLFTELLKSLDTVALAYGITLSEFVLVSLQGVVLGLFGRKLFNQGDRYFTFIDEMFDTKETAILVRIGLMTSVSVVLGLVIPHVIKQSADFVVLQGGGAVILLGYVLVHLEIQNWKLSNEFPVLLASFLLAVVPALR